MIKLPRNIKQTLRDIGLDRTESQVYVLLLTSGLLCIQDISRHLQLPRSSVHLACENLLQYGVLTISRLGKRRLFYVDDPKHIENFLLYKRNQLESKLLSLQSILPWFNTLYDHAQKSE